jgi:hypothetical protein
MATVSRLIRIGSGTVKALPGKIGVFKFQKRKSGGMKLGVEKTFGIALVVLVLLVADATVHVVPAGATSRSAIGNVPVLAIAAWGSARYKRDLG